MTVADSIASTYSPRMSSESYHEPVELISETTKDLHRAIVSLKEELDAVDWYQQRAEACSDDELREILLHNRNEEVEHAMMVLEWLRRRSPVFEKNVGIYLNSNGPITALEEAQDAGEPKGTVTNHSNSLGIGSLKAGT